MNSKILFYLPTTILQALKLISTAKSTATSSTNSTSRIVSDAYSSIPSHSVFEMPKESSLKRTLQRARHVAESCPPEPASLLQLVLREEDKVLSNQERWLLFDSGPVSDRLLIFSTQKSLRLLRQAQIVFSDGTFKCAPSRLFPQLYTIHAKCYGSVVPLVYCLLPNKREATYRTLINALLDNVAIAPIEWHTDFERAAINVINEKFNGIAKGCFFHFTQCLYRKVVELGLKQPYEAEDGNFAHSIRQISALAFVPEDDVPGAYLLLRQSDQFDQRTVPLFGYFEDTWVGVPGSNRQPLFPISLWNVYRQTLAGEHRTNNALEGWHRSLQSKFNCANPSVFKCIKSLKREQGLISARVARYESGESPPPPRMDIRKREERIKTIVERYPLMEKLDYLSAIARNYKF